jgi:STAM-binding protein
LCRRLHTARTHHAQAQVYEAEGNDAQTYLLLYRHADLVLQKLQAHPDRNKPENRKALNAATTTVSRDLKKLEELASRIKKRHEEFEERRKRQLDSLKSLEGKSARDLSQELHGLSIQDWRTKRRSYDSKPTIDARAQENQSLAARLAQREVRRRDTGRRSTRPYGVPDADEQARRSGGTWEDWQADGEDISNQLQEVARLQQNGHRTSYSPVSRVVLVHVVLVLTECSVQRLNPHPHTTTLPYPTRQLKKGGQTRRHATQPLPGLLRNRYTDPQALP